MAIMIHSWFITARNDNPYAAPETGDTCLAGKIDWHPELNITPEECDVTTSAIASISGRTVRTVSGREYELDGEPNQYFHDFLKLREIEFNPENPLHEANLRGFIHR